MSDTGGDIIIKGGSVEVRYNPTIYTRDAGDPKKNQNVDRKITRVLVADQEGVPVYDSGEDNSGLSWEVTVFTK